MRIKVINPNTTWAMTAKIEECAWAVAGSGTFVEAVSPAMGPASIESHYDEALSVPGILTEIASGEKTGVDGYVIACVGDPGLDAARELARGPVVAIAEAFYIRGALTYAVGGGVVGLACYLGLVPFDPATMRFDGIVRRHVEVMTGAGIVAGLIYWVIAGRRAGAWRTPRRVSAAPSSIPPVAPPPPAAGS